MNKYLTIYKETKVYKIPIEAEDLEDALSNSLNYIENLST